MHVIRRANEYLAELVALLEDPLDDRFRELILDAKVLETSENQNLT